MISSANIPIYDRQVISQWLTHQGDVTSNGILDAATNVLKDSNQSESNTQLALKKINLYCHNKIVNPINRLFLKLSDQKKLSELEIINETVAKYINVNSSEAKDITTNDQALMRFFLQFEENFKVNPKSMTQPEKLLLSVISEKIWDSSNVQNMASQSEKFQAYSEIMKNYFKGAHIIFEKNSVDSTLKQLLRTVSFKKDKMNLGKDNIALRVSSHYVRKIGEHDHYHLAGRQIPETVFGEVALPEKNGVVIPGTRYSMYLEKKPEEVTDIKPKKFFWIQTENNPDGPDWTSYLKHRSIDFVIYVFRKKLGFKHANVGPYGYGPGDMNPIVIKIKK